MEKSNHNAMRHLRTVAMDQNFDTLNSTPVKSGKPLDFPIIHPEVSPNTNFNLEEIPNLPCPIIIYFELLDYLRTGVFLNDFEISKNCVHFMDE